MCSCLLGGIGLAVYFRNIIDLVFPVVIFIGMTIFLGTDPGWLVGALLAATYGYFRVTLSAPPLHEAASSNS